MNDLRECINMFLVHFILFFQKYSFIKDIFHIQMIRPKITMYHFSDFFFGKIYFLSLTRVPIPQMNL